MTPTATLQNGLAFHRAGRLAEAAEVYQLVLATDADNFECLHLLGLAEFQLGRPEQAVRRLRRALEINSQVPPAHNNYGIVLNLLKRHEEAVATFDRAIALAPHYAEAHLNRGRALGELGRLTEAVQSFELAITLNPNSVEAHNDRGKALGSQGGYKDALASFDRVIALRPDFAEAHGNRGLALVGLKRDAEAIESFAQAPALNPDTPQLRKDYANALLRLSRLPDALASFDLALELDPACADTLNARGIALRKLGRAEEAVDSFMRAAAADPQCAEAHNNLGAALTDLKRYAEALESCDRTIELIPASATAHYNRALALEGLSRIDEAIDGYSMAIANDPLLDVAEGKRLHALMQICEWEDLEVDTQSLLQHLDAGRLSAPPFVLLSVPSSLAQQKAAAELNARSKAPTVAPYVWKPRRQRGAKLHIGYFSADFHNHATAHLIAGLFEAHDRANFEITGFSFGKPALDEMGRRISSAFGQFFDLAMESDEDIAALARDLDIDIAVDLKGLTFESRPGIFAHRAAPIQVSYLGYPGTMGLAAMDYLIADPVLIPEEHRAFYSEKIAYLPPSYQVNDSKRPRPTRTFTRAELSLPATAFVFCCFNNTWKLTPQIFDVWMRLLGKVDGSVLWLLEGTPLATENLRREAEQRGISGSRLVFAPRMSPADHLSRHTAADLFLDTVPYNAHTTASDALWAGVPLVTILGDTFAGRVAASLLTAMGLPDLITPDLERYEALAVELATQPGKLAGIKKHLQQQRLTSPLFDTVGFTRNIEAMYGRMWDIYDAGGADTGGAPEHLTVLE